MFSFSLNDIMRLIPLECSFLWHILDIKHPLKRHVVLKNKPLSHMFEFEKKQSIDGADFEISFDFLLVATEIGMTRDPSLCM